MSASEPEAGTKYSRGQSASSGKSEDSGGRPGTAAHERGLALPVAILVGGVLGSALLLVAEFTPLLEVRSSARAGIAETIGTGSHQSYALVPVAVLALVLTLSVWGSGNRVALLATGLLGLLSLLIALLGDLPDAQSSGLIARGTQGLTSASSSPSVGLYLETLGAIVLMITAGAGLLLTEPAPRPPSPTRGHPGSPRSTSAS